MNRSNNVLLYHALGAQERHRHVVDMMVLENYYENPEIPIAHYQNAYYHYYNIPHHPPMNFPPPYIHPPPPMDAQHAQHTNYDHYWRSSVPNAEYFRPRRRPSALYIPPSPDMRAAEDLNLDDIYRESQQYNSYIPLNHRLDDFFSQGMVDRIQAYIANSWPQFMETQLNTINSIVLNKEVTVFDQLRYFGYDSLINSEFDDSIQVINYMQILNDFGGITTQNLQETRNRMAAEFAVNSSLSDPVIAACDEHFERSPRTRMPYTQMFSEN